MQVRRALALSLLSSANLAAQGKASIVSTDWLAKHLTDPSVVVLHMARDSQDYRAGHVPGASELQYSSIIVTVDGNRVELPPVEQLQQVFERLGVSDTSHVVIYAAAIGMAPMASRAFFSLDYLGHRNVSLLSGGLAKWRAENRTVSTDEARPQPGRLSPRPRDSVVDADWVTSRTGKKGISFIDTRTGPEYVGTGELSGIRSEGHVAGARQLEWQQLFANPDSGIFLDPSAIAQLYADRSAAGDTLITYCLVGYRASMTYFGARILGLPVRLYDGSYQDWSRRAMPVKKGDVP